MVYMISRRCIGCGACAGACPVKAIREGKPGEPRYVVDREACIGCGLCRKTCMYDVPMSEQDYEKFAGSFEGHEGRRGDWHAHKDWRAEGHGDWLGGKQRK